MDNNDFVIVNKDIPHLSIDMDNYLNSYSGYVIGDKNNNVIVLPTSIGKLIYYINNFYNN